MSQHERATKQTLTSVWVARPVPIDESREDLNSVRARIAAGQAFLQVVEYPWGVEFDLCEVEGER